MDDGDGDDECVKYILSSLIGMKCELLMNTKVSST